MSIVQRTANLSYDDIDEVTDPSGLVAVISRSRKRRTYAVAFFHQFERDGQPKRTAFIPEDQIEALSTLVARVRTRISDIKKSGA